MNLFKHLKLNPFSLQTGFSTAILDLLTGHLNAFKISKKLLWVLYT